MANKSVLNLELVLEWIKANGFPSTKVEGKERQVLNWLRNHCSPNGKNFSVEASDVVRALGYGSRKKHRKVRCVTTGVEFDSLTEAAAEIGVSPQNLWSHLNGKAGKTCCGFVFEYVGVGEV